jgi:xanthine dehydrogenase accessory factor
VRLGLEPAGTTSGIYDLGREGTVFACRYARRPTVIAIGAVHIAEVLVRLAQVAGYHTIVIDPRRAFASQERFAAASEVIADWPQRALPRLDIDSATAICALTHDEKIDVPALELAVGTRAGYIGCIGGFKTLRERVASLADKGVAPAELARVFAPIGLYIGGSTPAQIAVSILAQIQAVEHGRTAFGAEMPGHTLATIPKPEANQSTSFPRRRESSTLPGIKGDAFDATVDPVIIPSQTTPAI